MAGTVPAPTDSRPRLIVRGEEYIVDTDPETDAYPRPVRVPTLSTWADGSLVLAPPRRLYLLVLLVAVTLGIGYFVLERVLRDPAQPWWAILLIFPALAIKLYASSLHARYRASVRFDRAGGRVEFGRGAGGHDLASVAALQLVRFREEAAGGQLHLVLMDLGLARTSVRALPRRLIVQGQSVDRLRDIARRIATTIGVPFLDHADDRPA